MDVADLNHVAWMVNLATTLLRGWFGSLRGDRLIQEQLWLIEWPASKGVLKIQVTVRKFAA
jgi:hypothetical protein